MGKTILIATAVSALLFIIVLGAVYVIENLIAFSSSETPALVGERLTPIPIYAPAATGETGVINIAIRDVAPNFGLG